MTMCRDQNANVVSDMLMYCVVTSCMYIRVLYEVAVLMWKQMCNKCKFEKGQVTSCSKTFKPAS